MNKFISIAALLLVSGCICEPGCETYIAESFSIFKDKWNYRTTDVLNIPFDFSTSHSETKSKWHCAGYHKSECSPTVSDEILDDSTSIFCNKTLKSGSHTYASGNNLLDNNDIDQMIEIPSSIYSKNGGNYILNLNHFTFSTQDLASPFVFTIQIETDKGIYSDTTILTIQP